MKKLFLLFFIFTTVLYAQTAIVPINKAKGIVDMSATSSEEDPVWQKDNGSRGTVSPYRNFEALINSDNTSGVAPPDSDGNIYNTQVNNISYWVELAEKGLVPFNPPVTVKPAELGSSLINIRGVVQNSPDIVILNNPDYIQSENSVFVDPNNILHVLNSNNSRGWDGSSATTGYGASYFNSYNGGYGWSGSYQGAGGTNKGDPAACIGTNGRQYIGSISLGRGQGVGYSDNGTSWTYVTVGADLTYPDLLDKNHLWIDNTTSSQAGNLYDAWTRFESGHANDVEIEFSRSTNDGVTWSAPYQISSNVSAGNHNQGVNICCNNTGWVFATWVIYDDWSTGNYGEDAIAFARSNNGGASFFPAQRIHDNILGIRPSPYSPTTNPTGKNMRVNSFPSMAIDVSGGTYNGHQYIVWANVGVPGTNTGTNVSIYMIKSINGGTAWSTPIRVNQGTSANGYASFFPWITCDPVTGNLFCIFYDDRDLGSASSAVETWLAYSFDGGLTWDDFKISDVSFTPAPVPGLAAGYFGDYLGVTARDNFVYPAWTDNRSGRALTYVSPFVFDGPCIASGGGYEHISRVQIGSIDNITGSDNYTDYTNLSANIPLNGSDGLTVTMGDPYSTSDQCGVWVDWNRDNDFDDANETILVSGTPGLGPYTATIDPPASATLGECTMRVRITYSGAVDPCGSTSFGEVEDYTLNIYGIPGLWTGVVNHFWNNPGNWDDGLIPTSATNVTIPDGTPNDCSVSAYDGFCNNITVELGALLRIYDEILTVSGNMTIYGLLKMEEYTDFGELHIAGNIVWGSGSTALITSNTLNMFISGNWNFESGANVHLDQGYVTFEGSSAAWIRSYDSDCYFNNIRNYKTGTYGLAVSEASTEDLYINGNIYNYSGNLFRFRSNHSVLLNGFFNNMNGHFEGQSGTLVFDGSAGIALKPNTGDYLNNVTISTTSTLSLDNTYSSLLTVNGNMLIETGGLNAQDFTIEVGGNWTNTGGSLTPGTSMVVFDGSDHQDVNGTNTFYDVNQVNTGYYLRFYGNTTINNLELNYFSWAYNTINVNGTLNIDNPSSKFTANGSSANATIANLDQGGIIYCNGTATITINDLTESYITGTYYAHDPGGVINISNGGSYVDLGGNLIINGGTMNISGNYCYWPYNNDASVTMTDGVLDVTSCGIYLSSSNTLTETITGGTIRTAYGFTGARTDFNPTGGTIELYGSTDASLSMGTGSNFYDVQINKAASDKIERESKNKIRTIQDRDGSVIELTRSETVNAASDLVINGNLQIDNGTLDLTGFNVNVRYILHNHGNLIVDSTLDIGDDCYYYSGSSIDLSGTMQIGTYTGRHGSSLHNAGSTFNQTAGNYYVESIRLYDGSQFNGTGGITHMYVNGHVLNNNIEIDDPDSYFYNFYVDSGANAALSGCSYDLDVIYTTNLYGPLDINSYTMNTLYSNVYGGGEFIIDSGGTVNVTGNGPYFQSTSSLTMISGSELNSNLHIRFYTGSIENVSGGEIFIAGDFSDYNEIFSPTGGSVTFDGSSASSVIGPTAFYDLNIDKTGATVTANSSFSVSNNLDITSGALTLNGFTVDVANGVDVYGTLNMTNAADILNVGDAAYDNFTFKNGSFGNLTAGEVNLASWVSIEAGGLLTATTGNTMNFNAPGLAGIQVIAAGSVFGNINVISSNPFYLSWSSTQQIEVDGNFDLQAGNTIDFQSESMIVHGNFTDDPTSTIYVYDGPVDRGNTKLYSANDNSNNQNILMDSRSRGGYFEIDNDFTLTGLMDVGDGNVLHHGEFELAATGTLTIDGGSFISDAPYSRDRAWQNIYGELNLSDGLFEITNNSLQFVSGTHNVTGGTIRVGEIFYALNPGVFQPSNGEVEMSVGHSGGSIVCSNGNYFYNLIINDDTSLSTDLTINHNLEINAGTLSVNGHDIEIGGNWTNNVGASGFVEGIQTVTFNGPNEADITTNETFYNLTLDKVSSADWLTLNGDLTIGNDLVINPGALNSGNHIISVSGNVIVNSGGTLYMLANSTLELDTGSALNVYSGGELQVIGTAGNLATITHRSTGNYAFNVYSGGTISAEYGLFEHMTSNGVYVRDGGFVDPSHSFDYCTFQNGYVGSGTLLYIENDEDITITGANFPDASSTFYNVAKIEDHGTITMVNYTGIFSGEVYDYDYYERIDWGGLSAIDDLTIQYNSGTDEIELNWTYPVPVDQFKIYRSTDPYDFSGADVFTVYTESYSEPATGINYFYQVTAEDISDNGGTRGKTGRSDSASLDK